MSERKVKLVLAYDGSRYHGWQRQRVADPDAPGSEPRHALPTVQQELETALARVVHHPVSLRAAGRTDAGVHALGQVANFRTDAPIPDDRLPHALNARLPADLRVRHALTVPDCFDAATSARSKLYRYRVFAHHDLPPAQRNYCYHFWRPYDPSLLHAAAARLLGAHDFRSFASAGAQPKETTVRTLLRCQVWQQFHWLYFDLEADGFLYHMVRNIVGTLLEIARRHWPPDKIEEILAARRRSAAGPMAPPQGLYLMWVKYPGRFDEMPSRIIASDAGLTTALPPR